MQYLETTYLRQMALPLDMYITYESMHQLLAFDQETSYILIVYS